jgi:hypothetical protein
MSTGQSNGVIRELRRVRPDSPGRTDRQLREHYLRRRDDAGLAALVRRHGRMVWGVYRHVLGHHQDAEDAFQATFLVLVRRSDAPGLM